MTNHIFLIFEYFGKLKDLAMVLHWIELSTREHAGEPDVLAILDRKRTQVTLEKIRLQDEMFEIRRAMHIQLRLWETPKVDLLAKIRAELEMGKDVFYHFNGHSLIMRERIPRREVTE
jgi:hypothetical protein